ncbi:MAG: two-component system sensor histidine kinase EvgS [Colwellia sp.]|jgi:two-component system sensor histidine kinase EvgS
MIGVSVILKVLEVNFKVFFIGSVFLYFISVPIHVVASELLIKAKLSKFHVDDNTMPRSVSSKAKSIIIDIPSISSSEQNITPVQQQTFLKEWTEDIKILFNKYTQKADKLVTVWLVSSLLTIILIGGISLIYMRSRHHRAKEVIQRALDQSHISLKEAERSEQSKSEFLARMSHEIRTPMNGVLGMVEALSFTSLGNEQKDLLDTLNHSATNLMALLNNVLDFSKMEAGKFIMESTPMNLKSLTKGVVDMFQYEIRHKGLQLSLTIDANLSQSYLGDPTCLMQVLNNLISNSIKFTHAGCIELSVHKLEVDLTDANKKDCWHKVRFDIRDTGIGIAPEKHSSLFESFVQAESDTRRKFGGSGLGLFICKEIVDAMKGNILVSSIPGHGSLFSVVLLLPVGKEEPKFLSESPSRLMDEETLSEDIRSCKILLAEDNKINRKVLLGQIRRLGIEVDSAENGLIAYEMYQKSDYDVVLTDCHMPEMDGFALAAKISAEREGTRPVLLALTADTLNGIAQKCLDAGFDDYLSKPCQITTLRATLNELIKISSTTQRRNKPHVEKRAVDILAAGIISEKAPDNVTKQVVNVEDIHLNREYLMNISGDDVDIVLLVLTAYIKTSPTDCAELLHAYSDGHNKVLSDVVHRIQGGFRYFGAKELVKMTQKIHSISIQDIQGHSTELDKLIIDLELSICILTKEIEQWHDEITSKVLDHSK